MATQRSSKSISALKKSRKFRTRSQRSSKESKRLHLEPLEDRRMMAVAPPVFILPNNGVLLNSGDTRTVAPKDLTFRFTDISAIDPTTISSGIRVTRAGNDGVFGDANDRVINPGFIGLGDNNREVVMRFVDTLPDDTYRIEIIGAGTTPLRDNNGNAFNAGVNFSQDFRLDLGAQVIAIVPQPVTRNANGQLQQARNQIVVYFNNDNLDEASAERVEFYRLYVTKNTLDPADDTEVLPTSVVYDPVTDTAVLTFAQNIDTFAPDDGSRDPAKSFRLRIGTDEQRRLSTQVNRLEGTDPQSTFAGALSVNPILTAGVQGGSVAYSQAITETQPFTLAWPGDGTEPGHRDIPAEVHLHNRPDSVLGIETVAYNFQSVIGTIPDGATSTQPAFNLITEAQKQRAREVLELFSRYAGIQFVETDDRGITIATGDMRAVLPTILTGPGGISSIGDPFGLRAVMDNGETWEDDYGGSWFRSAMQAIGIVLGHGFAYDLPDLTLQNGGGSVTPPLNFNSPPAEPVFPGDHDIVHNRVLYRPEGKDIDMYKFTLDGTGVFTAETFAERLPNASSLDTSMTLYKEGPNGIELFSRNDDYFSKDSYIQLNLGPGTYYIGVSASGNDNYDPTIPDSGIGGTTQGAYELKLDFRKSATQSIVDAQTPVTPPPTVTPAIPDSLAVPFDGDADGTPGGVYNFWFRAAAPEGSQAVGKARTIFVDKSYNPAVGGASTGSLARPFNNLGTAIQNAQPFDIVRVVGNNGADGNAATLNDNLAYQLGFDDFGNVLPDGAGLNVPKNVTVMVDAGAIFQMRRSQVSVGSTAPSSASDRSGGALQVLGTTTTPVYFTSYNETGASSIGRDQNPLNNPPAQGDWGGLAFTSDLDRADGRFDHEAVGVFLNYVNHADIRFGGGQVNVNSKFVVVTPISMTDARPTATFNTIRLSADAAMSANPDSFEETNFQAPRYWSSFSNTATYQPSDVAAQASSSYTLDYKRVGPDIHGNRVVENSTNGLFVRTTTPAGDVLEELTVAARFDDLDIVHVLQENLVVRGTPGGTIQELAGPPTQLIVPTFIAPSGAIEGNGFTPGQTLEYRLVYIDLLGNEGLASQTFTPNSAVPTGATALRLTNLPIPTGEFVARRLYRRINGAGEFTLVAQIPASATTIIDENFSTTGTQNRLRVLEQTPTFDNIRRPRLDGSLKIDASMILKSDGARIDVDVGANLIAEAVAGQEIIFTSRFDDRYGAGGTFDTPNDNTDANPKTAQPGDWGGIFFNADSGGSIDHAVFAFAGGLTRVQGTFAGFNTIEIHQSDVRIAHTEFESNADGSGGQAELDRFGRGFNRPATIFVRGAQPVILDNIVHDNAGAFISINVNALNSDRNVDLGRQSGLVDRTSGHLDNNGPLIVENQLVNNEINGMVVRGATLTTESVWDDTDIVHVLLDHVNVPDFHTFGGLRLESSATESLVVKASGATAGITATGRPLEIEDRIGGIVQILGQPGFPVVLTSITDDTAGAGFTPEGIPQTDTNGDSFFNRLPVGLEVNNGTRIDNDVAPAVIGHFEVVPQAGGSIVQAGATARGQSLLFANQDFLNQYLHYVDIGAPGGAVDLSTTTVTMVPTLVVAPGPNGLPEDRVISEGTFAGANGLVRWRVETRIDDGATSAVSTLTFTSTNALGPLRLISYLDQDILAANDDMIVRLGSPGQPGFRLATIDNQERIGFAIGGVYRDGLGLVNATYDGFAADKAPDLQGSITGAIGAVFSRTGVVDTVDLPAFVDPALGNVNGLGNATAAMSWTVTPTATTATITTFLDIIPRNPRSSGMPGEWQGVTLDRFAHDRNVETILELESATGDGLANSIPDKAQQLGGLAPFEKGGDENLRLGFTVHGLINNPGDLDVYSFSAKSGTEIWVELDRTWNAFDGVVELIDNLGNVLARSNDSTAESANPANSLPNSAFLTIPTAGIARLMQKTPPYEGVDYYTTNPRDAGMRIVLEGPGTSVNTYHIRVRSNSTNLDALPIVTGQSSGAYQLQVRLREVDELGGSTVRFAKIANAVNGIRVLGGPSHSPLTGEHAENQALNNNTLPGAQFIGNLLNSDRGALSTAGFMTDGLDVDWYRMNVNYDATGNRPPENWWSTIFDIDYADGLARPNMVIYVFDPLGNLLLTSRDSNIGDDRPNPLDASGVADLSRGSAGGSDGWIGPTELPQGTYLVAVATDQLIPQVLNQFTQAGATNPLVRLEPMNSVTRIVDDHIGSDGGSTAASPQVLDFVEGSSVIPWHLGDVSLYVLSDDTSANERSQIRMVDPFTGATEISFAAIGGPMGKDIGDIAFRADNGLFAYELDNDGPGGDFIDDSEAGRFLQIDDGTGNVTTLVDDNIITYEPDPMATMPPPMPVVAHLRPNQTRVGYGVHFNALAFGPVVGNGNGQRLVAVGNRGEASGGADGFSDFTVGNNNPLNDFLDRRRNIVYAMDPNTGVAPVQSANPRLNGAATSALEMGEILTSARINVGNPATSFVGSNTVFNFTDGLSFSVNGGLGPVTFEFDSGPEVRQLINIRPAVTGSASPNDQPLLAADLAQPTLHIADGDFFILDRDADTTNTNAQIFQFDTGSAFTVINASMVTDGLTFSVTDTATPATTRVFEFDGNMAVVTNGATPVPISTNNATLAQNIVTAITMGGGGGGGGGTQLTAIRAGVANNRVLLIGEGGLAMNVAGITVDSDAGNAPVLQAVRGDMITDGNAFRLTIGGVARVFEFEKLGNGTGTNIPIVVDNTMTSADVANAMQTAIDGQFSTIATDPARLAGTDRLIINGQSPIFAAVSPTVNNPIANLMARFTAFPISSNSVTSANAAVTVVVEENTSARPIGLAVETVVNNAGGSVFNASFAHQRINFPPLSSPEVAANKVPAVSLDASGVQAWQQQASQTGVGVGNEAIPFRAGDVAGQQFFNTPGVPTLAQRVASAINRASAPGGPLDVPGTNRITAAASGANVQLSSGAVAVTTTNPATLSTQGEGPGGTVTGLANLGNRLYAVSTAGGLYEVVVATNGFTANANGSTNVITTNYIRTSGADLTGIEFQGVTRGPQDVEGGRYDNMLFAVDTTGRMYAFNATDDANGLAGELQPIFLNGATSMATGISDARGLAFSTLEHNLFHATPTTPSVDPVASFGPDFVDPRGDGVAINERQGDAGHGIVPVFDQSRVAVAGGNSLHFGIGMNGQYDGEIAQGGGSLDLPGGAYGTVVSNEFSLTGSSPGDQPTLYFNYFANTQNQSRLLTQAPPMLDSVRVYIAGNDGRWELLGTNNSAVGAMTNDDEFDYGRFGQSSRVEEIFDAPSGWRQVRIDLSGYAGQDNLRVRFEYASGGTINTGDTMTAGDELRAVAGEFITDGQTFSIGNQTFELEMGHSLHVSSGSAYQNQDGRTFTITPRIGAPVTFEIDVDNSGTGANTRVDLSGNLTSQQVAQRIISAIGTAGFAAPFRTFYLNDTIINLPDARLITNNLVGIPGFQSGAFGVTGGIEVPIHRGMDRVEVATSINNVLETVFYDQQIVARSPFDPPTVQNGPQTQRIFDGDTFTVDSVNGTSVTFEFDSGRVLSIPSLGGAAGPNTNRVEDGDGFALTINGVQRFFEFDFDNSVPPPAVPVNLLDHVAIPMSTGLNQLSTAQAIVATINNTFGAGTSRVLSGSRVQLDTTGDAASAFMGGRYIAPNTLGPASGGKYAGINVDGTPGVTPASGNLPVLFAPSTTFTAQQMAQAIAAAINASPLQNPGAPPPVNFATVAANARRVTLNGPDVTVTTTIPGLGLEVADAIANDVVKQHEDLLHIIGRPVTNAGPLGLATYAPLDGSSPRGIEGQEFGGFGDERRAQANVFEGLYIDDIVIGFAERGEIATNPVGNSTFVANPRANPQDIVTGSYQLEVRRGTEFGVPNLPPILPPLRLFDSFDTNARLSQSRALFAPTGAQLADAVIFTLSDGINEVTFEFNDASVPGNGVAQGRIPINYLPTDTDFRVAQRVRDAIHTPAVQAVLTIAAQLGDGILANNSTTNQVNLLGAISVPFSGSSVLNFVTYQNGDRLGSLTPFGIIDILGEDPPSNADTNRFRDQGQIILQGNEIRNSSQWGILVDAGARTAADGNTPHSGPVRPLREENTTRLVPGVVVTNNVLFDNTSGGIRFSGEPNAVPNASVPFGRIVNNTIFGSGGTLGNTRNDVGIQVDENAGPTLMNNVVVNFRTGINVDASSQPNTVLGGSLFQANTVDSNVNTQGFPGDFPIQLQNSDPLFVNFAARNFYLRAQTQAIDSSVDSLLDRPSLVTVKSPLEILPSPIITPDRDGVGQLRVDDPGVSPPQGFGLNPFKDRGAIDRVDFSGPTSGLINPQDNDAAGVDLDPNPTVVVLNNQIVRDFSIRLIDRTDPNGPAEGSDIDDFTIDGTKVRVEVIDQSGATLLEEATDYSFSYDSTNNIIRLQPTGGLWPLSATYRITLDNSILSGITDRAGNILRPNQTDGTHTYTIFLGSAVDFGDAPDTYKTLSASSGPSHQVVSGIFLGSTNGAEADGKPSVDANFDNSDDGLVAFTLQPNGGPGSSSVTIVSSVAARLDAWIDLNQDGDFEDTNEYAIQGANLGNDLGGNRINNLAAGSNVLSFQLTVGQRGPTFARFRMSTEGIATPTGPANDGEVEDYKVTLVGPAYQNGLDKLDVDNSGFVSAIDALIVINFINFLETQLITAGGSKVLPPVSPPYINPPPVIDPSGNGIPGDGRFLDVNGNGVLEPLDVLEIINYLNSPAFGGESEGEGEGEAPAAAPLAFKAAEAVTVGSPIVATSQTFASLAAPAALYASPSIVIEERTLVSDSFDGNDAWFASQADLLDLDLLAHGSTHSPEAVGAALSLEEYSKADVEVGPLDDQSWDDLLAGLAAEVHGQKGKVYDMA